MDANSKFTARQFRDKVLEYMQAAFPARTFETVPDDPQLIVVDGLQLGLDNLQRKYDLSDKKLTLEELAIDHLTAVLQEASFPDLFEKAQYLILPQIMPSSFAQDDKQVFLPFAADLRIGFVVDDERQYTYINKEAIEKWRKNQDEIYRIALANLNTRSKGMQIETFTNCGTEFCSVTVADGYDAARILLPGLRKVIGQQLGAPFYFGVPNRDFLICWSQPEQTRTQEMLTLRLRSDYDAQPYPLSPEVFQVTADGCIAVAH